MCHRTPPFLALKKQQSKTSREAWSVIHNSITRLVTKGNNRCDLVSAIIVNKREKNLLGIFSILRTASSLNPSIMRESRIQFRSTIRTDSLALSEKNQVLNHKAALLERPSFTGESARRRLEKAKEPKENIQNPSKENTQNGVRVVSLEQEAHTRRDKLLWACNSYQAN